MLGAAITLPHNLLKYIMDSVAKKSWNAKRNKAIKRLVEVWKKSGATEDEDEDEDEAVSMATDAVTVAHIAAALEWEGRPSKGLVRRGAEGDGEARRRVGKI